MRVAFRGGTRAHRRNAGSQAGARRCSPVLRQPHGLPYLGRCSANIRGRCLFEIAQM